MPHKHMRGGKWTGKWLPQVKWRGRKQYGPLSQTKAEATAWEVHFKEALKRGLEIPAQAKPKTATVCLAEWANMYLDFALLRHPAKVYSEKKHVLARLVKKMGKDTPVDAITPAVAMEYLQGHFKERSGYAANKERKNLAAAWAWGTDYIDGFPQEANPFKRVKEFRHDAEPHYVPSEADFRAVEAIARGQDKVLLTTFLHTGARRGQVYNLKWPDLDFDKRMVTLRTRKTKTGSLKRVTVPMTDHLFHLLLQHRKGVQGEFVFVQEEGRNAGKPLTENRGFPQDLCVQAGVKPFGCHGIRGLSATMLYTEGVPEFVIQQILGHERPTTTDIYIRKQGGQAEKARPYLEVLTGGKGSGPNDGPNTKVKGPSAAIA